MQKLSVFLFVAIFLMVDSNNTTLSYVYNIMHRKPHLPSKTCTVCNRPFTWRKKWEKVWDEVKYCSDKCRKNRGHAEKE
ncbi:MAG: DUF2256 domain-containing protein [Arcticibacter sp.]